MPKNGTLLALARRISSAVAVSSPTRTINRSERDILSLRSFGHSGPPDGGFKDQCSTRNVVAQPELPSTNLPNASSSWPRSKLTNASMLLLLRALIGATTLRDFGLDGKKMSEAKTCVTGRRLQLNV